MISSSMRKLKHSFRYKSKHKLLIAGYKLKYNKAMLNENDDQQRIELANRIKEAIDSLGRGGKRRIAERCNISEQAITGWIKTGRIGKENVAAVAEMTGFDLNWLLTGTKNNRGIESNAKWYGGIKTWDSNTQVDDDEVAIPFFKEVELAAGHGSYHVEESIESKLLFSKRTLREMGVHPENAACVKVVGNSMEPVLPDGATVGIDTSVSKIKDGAVYAIDHDGHLRVKRLYRMPEGKIRLNSYNRDEWPDEYVDIYKIKILGKVFWSSVLWT